MHSIINDQTNGSLILKIDHEEVGSLTYYYYEKDKNLELTRLFINFAYRKKKYSSLLIKEIIKYAGQIGAKKVTLNIDPELEDCVNTLVREKGTKNDNEENPVSSFVDMDDDEIDKLIEKAKKLKEMRKNLLIHLFEKFGFTRWIRTNDNHRKNDFPGSYWVILRL